MNIGLKGSILPDTITGENFWKLVGLARGELKSAERSPSIFKTGASITGDAAFGFKIGMKAKEPGVIY